MNAIYKKELKSYFTSPVLYVMMALFMLLIGIFFYLQNLQIGYLDFSVTLQMGEYFLIFFAPIITMKLLAEEKKNKSDILLLTSPTSVTNIILGKFLASVTVFIIMVACTLIFPIIMNFFGEANFATLLGSYIGFILLGILFLSIGLLASSLSDSQALAAVVGIVALFILWVIGQVGTMVGGFIGKACYWISPIVRYDTFAKGMLSISNIVFYITFTSVILFITVINTERKRWSQG